MKEADKTFNHETGVTGSCYLCLLEQSDADIDWSARYMMPLHAMKVEFRP